jgi:hypothetical protein
VTKFTYGDRVVTVRRPSGVMPSQHEVGTPGTVREVLEDGIEYLVDFDDHMSWYCDPTDLESEKPLPTPEKALAGLNEILSTETFGEYIERLADQYDPVMQVVLGRAARRDDG